MRRRNFIKQVGAGGALVLAPAALASAENTIPFGKAENCIYLWFGGGMAQIDTFDPQRFHDAGSIEPLGDDLAVLRDHLLAGPADGLLLPAI